MKSGWLDIKKAKPPVGVDVLVYAKGHAGLSWRDDFTVVVYMDDDGNWWEKRLVPTLRLIEVQYWMPIPSTEE